MESTARHSRVTFPFRRIEALRDIPVPERSLDGLVTVVHHVFPNVVVARLSHHTAVMMLEPAGVDTTTVLTYRLTNDSGGAEADAV